MKFLKSNTNRGFNLIQFYDDNNELCDIQESSSVDRKIWLGTHNTNPQILAKETKQGGTGWVGYDIPRNVLITHRMHLTRKQSALLALKLLRFFIYGQIK